MALITFWKTHLIHCIFHYIYVSDTFTHKCTHLLTTHLSIRCTHTRTPWHMNVLFKPTSAKITFSARYNVVDTYMYAHAHTHSRSQQCVT